MIGSFDGHIFYQDLIQLLRSNSWPGFASRCCCQSRRGCGGTQSHLSFFPSATVERLQAGAPAIASASARDHSDGSACLTKRSCFQVTPVLRLLLLLDF